MLVLAMAPKLNSRGLQAVMDRHLNNLQAGRKPKPLPTSDQIKSPASETAKAARSVVRGALKGYFDLASFMFGSTLFPTFITGWRGKQLPAVQRIASLAVFVFFHGTIHNKKYRRKFFLSWIAHMLTSAYIARKQFLTDREEEQLPKVKAMYRNFRSRTIRELGGACVLGRFGCT